MTELENAIRVQGLRKEIAHTILHRMTWWQWMWKGREWREQYDEACIEITLLQDEESKHGT